MNLVFHNIDYLVNELLSYWKLVTGD